jgi:hypothetical protein
LSSKACQLGEHEVCTWDAFRKRYIQYMKDEGVRRPTKLTRDGCTNIFQSNSVIYTDFVPGEDSPDEHWGFEENYLVGVKVLA